MTQREKIKKVADAETYFSALRAVFRWTHPLRTAAILRGIDLSKFEQVGEQRETEQGIARADPQKYLNLTKFLAVNKRDAQELGLHRVQHRLQVADLGCGAGYFGLVCQQLGHSCTNLDVDANPLFGEMVEALGLERIVHRIRPSETLPLATDSLNLVTGLSVCFHRHGLDGEWSTHNWTNFMGEIARVLRPGGTLFLRFNRRSNGEYLPAEVLDVFRKQGAIVIGSRVYWHTRGRSGPALPSVLSWIELTLPRPPLPQDQTSPTPV